MSRTIQIRTGSVNLRFDENARIAQKNFMNGRPLLEGQLPPIDVPDPNGLPEWVTFTVPD